jgi:lysophospholipase L1-like esterase
MKTVAWNVALTAVITLVVLAALEAWLRYTIPPMQEGRLFEYSAKSKRLKLMKPLADVRIFGAHIHTNDLGFRDRQAHIPAKQPGEFRIVVLGDSFTFGPGVEYEHLYTTLLNSRLARSHPDVKVINLAVEGYNIIQYEAVLEEVGQRLQPDLLVVAMFPVNDFELGDYENHRRIALGGEPHLPWYLSLYVYRAYLHRIPQVASKLLARAHPRAASGPDIGWEQNVAALKQIHVLTLAHQTPLTVALLPHTKGFETQRKIFARVEEVCAAERLECLDLLESFRAAGVRDGALVLNAIDSHPNEEYHRLMSAQLAARLEPRIPPPLVRPDRVSSPTAERQPTTSRGTF